MTQQQDEVRALRALLAIPAIDLPDYGEDQTVRRRVGEILRSRAESRAPRL